MEGKMLPQNIELEQQVLGLVFTEPEGIFELLEVIKTPQVFYAALHQKIYSVMRELSLSATAIDMLTVNDGLRRLGVQDAAAYLVQISGSAIYTSTSEHALLLLETYQRRNLIAAAEQLIKKAYDQTIDALELSSTTAHQFALIDDDIKAIGELTWPDQVAIARAAVDQAGCNQGLLGLSTGSPVLDKFTNGFEKNNLIIIAARPGMGKTAAALDLAANQGLAQAPVGFISLEMSATQLIHRMFANMGRINLQDVRTGKLSDINIRKLDEATTTILGFPFYMADRINTLVNIKLTARRWVREHHIQALYIDYLQLIGTEDAGKKFGTREAEVSYISRQLKLLSGELNIPIIVLSQLSRKCEERSGFDKRPMLSDLRESGAIEQDADMVIFLFRPQVYGLTTTESGEQLNPFSCEWIFAKFRNGEVGVADRIFIPSECRFIDNTDSLHEVQMKVPSGFKSVLAEERGEEAPF